MRLRPSNHKAAAPAARQADKRARLELPKSAPNRQTHAHLRAPADWPGSAGGALASSASQVSALQANEHLLRLSANERERQLHLSGTGERTNERTVAPWLQAAVRARRLHGPKAADAMRFNIELQRHQLRAVFFSAKLQVECHA